VQKSEVVLVDAGFGSVESSRALPELDQLLVSAKRVEAKQGLGI
jgi:hypothetical protein